tara:strand:+ start:210 stop:497 length:288 start_codon:yes stop_codon:yes gene_type:complete
MKQKRILEIIKKNSFTKRILLDPVTFKLIYCSMPVVGIGQFFIVGFWAIRNGHPLLVLMCIVFFYLTGEMAKKMLLIKGELDKMQIKEKDKVNNS